MVGTQSAWMGSGPFEFYEMDESMWSWLALWMNQRWVGHWCIADALHQRQSTLLQEEGKREREKRREQVRENNKDKLCVCACASAREKNIQTGHNKEGHTSFSVR